MQARELAGEEARIRRLITDRAAAIRARDIDGALAHHAPDLVAYDLAPPLRARGPDALDRTALQEWFSTWDGPIDYEVRDLEVTAGVGLAYAHSLDRIAGTRTDGQRTSVWVRVTVCLRKRGDEWQVTHTHASVPFYMDGSLKAAVDLAP